MSYDNAVNDNMLNDKKQSRSPARLIKNLVKNMLKKNNKKKTPAPCYEETCDNFANELLENEIFEEIDSCDEDAAVPVYFEGNVELLEIRRGQRFVPVNFARTDAGTFFWTSVQRPDKDIYCDGEDNAICGYQTPQIQVPCDRWAQA